MAETAVFVMDKFSCKTESQNKSTVLTILNLTVIPYFYSILQTVIIRYLTLEPVYTALSIRYTDAFLYIKKFNASVGKGGYLPQSDRDDEDTLKTAAVLTELRNRV